MSPGDLIEDMLAFLYTNGGKKPANTSTEDTICQFCGAELEENEETGEMRCPEC